MLQYDFVIEDPRATYVDVEPLYRMHYAAMRAYLEERGVPVGDYNPRQDVFADLFERGGFIHYVVRHDGKIVGYCNIYITHDMHNGEKIAEEDTLFMLPAHRTGIGRQLIKSVLRHVKHMGCKRYVCGARVDPRTAKLWERMGARATAQQMIFVLKELP